MGTHTVLVLTADMADKDLALLDKLPPETNLAVGTSAEAFENLAPDADVILDLTNVFRVCYDRGEYTRILRYGTPLPASFPISAQDRAWAESIGPGG